MKIHLALIALFMVPALAFGEEIYKCEQNGKTVFQNWKCGDKPEIEKTPKEQPKNENVFLCTLGQELKATGQYIQSGQETKRGKECLEPKK